jgi:uncharacterized membrane protein YfhO
MVYNNYLYKYFKYILNISIYYLLGNFLSPLEQVTSYLLILIDFLRLKFLYPLDYKEHCSFLPFLLLGLLRTLLVPNIPFPKNVLIY